MSSSSPGDRRYTKTHEWAKAEADAVVVGITGFAVEALQDLVFIDLPKVGARVAAGERFGEIESVKAVSDLIAPVSGTVSAVNDALADALDTLNQDPYERGWMIRVKPEGAAPATALEPLLTATAYDRTTAEEH